MSSAQDIDAESLKSYLAGIVFVRTVVGPGGEGQLAPEPARLLGVFEQADHDLCEVAELAHIVQQVETLRGQGTGVALSEVDGLAVDMRGGR